MAANILIVEDENAILELIALNLHQSGFNPLRAISAEIADSLVKNTLPDLIVLDWMLPGMDGITFAKRLRANSDTKKIPIIMLTAMSENNDKIDKEVMKVVKKGNLTTLNCPEEVELAEQLVKILFNKKW